VHIGNRLAFPEMGKRSACVANAGRGRTICFGLGIVVKDGRYEDLIGITWPGFFGPREEEFAVDLFSLAAVSRKRAADAAATTFCPCDVIEAAALLVDEKSRSCVWARHGISPFSMKASIALSLNLTSFLPNGTKGIRP
jgi:hypothetical protein